MTYNLQDRLDLLGPRMNTVNGVAGTYVRDGVGTIDPITLSPILAEGQEFIPGVSITRVEMQDFALTAADIDFGSGEVKPEVGDLVTFQGNQYRLVSRGGDDPPFKYTTSSRKRIRVFTDLIGTVDPIESYLASGSVTPDATGRFQLAGVSSSVDYYVLPSANSPTGYWYLAFSNGQWAVLDVLGAGFTTLWLRGPSQPIEGDYSPVIGATGTLTIAEA